MNKNNKTIDYMMLMIHNNSLFHNFKNQKTSLYDFA